MRGSETMVGSTMWALVGPMQGREELEGKSWEKLVFFNW